MSPKFDAVNTLTLQQMSSLQQSFSNELHRREINPADGVLVAVSGGLDSMVLLDLFHRHGQKIEVAHVHHGLRAAADQEEALVVAYCQQYNIPCHVHHVPTGHWKNQNIQLEARRIRYAFFESLLDRQKLKYLATAHHADDALENWFLQLLRGSGLEGLSGWDVLKNNRLRPLLPHRKAAILAHAEVEKISWLEDESNLKDTYLRNQIRLQLLPILEQLDPRNGGGLQRSINHLRDAQNSLHFLYPLWRREALVVEGHGCLELRWQHLEELWLVNKCLEPIVHIHPDALQQLFDAKTGCVWTQANVQITRIKKGLYVKWGLENIDFENQHFENLDAFLASQFSGGLVPYEKEMSDHYPHQICLDADKIVFPVSIRKPNTQDRFRPIGFTGHVRLKKWLSERNLSHFEKEKSLVLCSPEKILAVLGLMPAHDFRMTQKTKRVLLLEKYPLNPDNEDH
jgi:tRNA(Ile)-lysidine synthase